LEEFERHWAHLVSPEAEPPKPVPMEFPDDLLAAESVAIHFVAGEGMSFYPGFHLLEELFGNPALISRRRYRETLPDFLREPHTSPEPLRRLAAVGPGQGQHGLHQTRGLHTSPGFIVTFGSDTLLAALAGVPGWRFRRCVEAAGRFQCAAVVRWVAGD